MSKFVTLQYSSEVMSKSLLVAIQDFRCDPKWFACSSEFEMGWFIAVLYVIRIKFFVEVANPSQVCLLEAPCLAIRGFIKSVSICKVHWSV